jgi:hypothetical protein
MNLNNNRRQTSFFFMDIQDFKIRVHQYFWIFFFNFALNDWLDILHRVGIKVMQFSPLYTLLFLSWVVYKWVLFGKTFLRTYAWRSQRIIDIDTVEWYVVDNFALIGLRVISFLLRISFFPYSTKDRWLTISALGI